MHRLLEDLVANSVELAHLSDEQRIALLKAAGEISRPDREEIRKRKRDRIRLKKQRIDDHERNIRKATGIRSAREAVVFTAPQSDLTCGQRKRISATAINQSSRVLHLQEGVYQGPFFL